MKMKRIYLPFEVKAASDGKTVSGYGSVFGNVDAYGDTIAPGAFDDSLSEHAGKGTFPAMLWQHNPDWPIGRWTEIREDERGLAVEGRLADTAQARDVGALVRMGAISGASIGFVTKQSKVDEETGVRTLTKIDLWEVSLVTFPANEAARVEARKAAIEDFQTEKEYEKALRDGGFSYSEAKALLSGLKGLFASRDEARIEARARELMRERHAEAWRARILSTIPKVKG